jgi:hypothetical protein
MPILLTKLRTVVYRATVVANARYREDVLNLQAMSLTYSTPRDPAATVQRRLTELDPEQTLFTTARIWLLQHKWFVILFFKTVL